MQSDLTTSRKSQSRWGWPLIMAFIRLPLIVLGYGAVLLVFWLAGYPVGVATGAAWSTLSVTLANVWGVGAGIIFHRQQRLAPLIVAHCISNLSFGIVPLFFFLGGR